MRVNEIKQILKMNKNELLIYLAKEVRRRYGKKKCMITENYILAIGNLPVGLVAHLDTVFRCPPEITYYDSDYNIMWSPGGSGFDDRAGVCAIIDTLRRGYLPTVIFTMDEEIGGIGARALVKEQEKPRNLKFLIELDRRGSDDAVYYNCDNPKFEKFINNFGFTTAIGSFSDISVIMPEWNVAGVNLSIGYYNEHTESELLNLFEMKNTEYKLFDILEYLEDNEIRDFKYIKREALIFNPHFFNNNCIICQSKFTEDNQNVEALDTEGNAYPICEKCYESYFTCDD